MLLKNMDDGHVSAAYYHYSTSFKNNYSFYENIEIGYTQITLDQFKKYVLKEEIHSNNESLDYLIDLFEKLNIN